MTNKTIKRKIIVRISVWVFYTIYVLLTFLAGKTGDMSLEGVSFVLFLVYSFPSVPAILSIYSFIESILNKSYKNVITWICGMLGFIIALSSLGLKLISLVSSFGMGDLLNFIYGKNIFFIPVIAAALILLFRIGEFLVINFDSSKRRTIINISVYLLHALSVLVYVLAKGFLPGVFAFIAFYMITFPFILVLLSLYDVVECLISKSYKAITMWICCGAGFVIIAMSILSLHNIISEENSVKVIVVCSVLIAVCRIGEFIRRVTKDNVFTNVIYISSGVLALFIAIAMLINALPIYNENWIIGKTAEEIQERYGEFEYKSYRYEMDEDRNYKLDEEGNEIIIGWYAGGYITKEERHDFFFGDVIPREYIRIEFDENGVAVKIVRNWINTKSYL